MSLSITNALQISALSSPPSPTDDPPSALCLGGTLRDRRADLSVVPSSTSPRLARLQQTNLISCSAALQMAPGSQTKAKDGDALMAIMAA